jgi:hypothetical protein
VTPEIGSFERFARFAQLLRCRISRRLMLHQPLYRHNQTSFR